MTRQTCHFRGTVQGVGFRYTVKSLAAGFAVAGYVKNLSEGKVLLVMEGPPDQTEGLLAAVRREMAGHIDDVEIATSASTGEFRGFSIRH